MAKKVSGAIANLKENHGETVRIDEISDVVESLLAAIGGDSSAASIHVMTELESLSTYIHSTLNEIAAFGPDEVKDEYLTMAAGELDAIITATSEATHAIMDATDTIDQAVADASPEVKAKVQDGITIIFEACGFQDITGQRISRVVTALQHIEERIDGLISAVDGKPKAAKKTDEPAAQVVDEITDQDLLHGPQDQGVAKTQEEIDALLADFD